MIEGNAGNTAALLRCGVLLSSSNMVIASLSGLRGLTGLMLALLTYGPEKLRLGTGHTVTGRYAASGSTTSVEPCAFVLLELQSVL